MSRIAAVVLAAGRATRFGGNKLLATIDGRAVLRIVLDAVLPAVDEVVIVLGHDAERIRPLIRELPVRAVVNPQYVAGLGTSVAAGVSALGDDVDAAVIVLGDQPLPARVLPALIEAYRHERALIVAPSYDDVRGNPVLFDRQLFPALRELRADRGARYLVEQFGDRVVMVPFDFAAPIDIDTREDHAAMRQNRRPE